MLAHTFRGSTWRSAIGLEDSRAVFARYKAIRRAEREYLGSVSGLGSRVSQVSSLEGRGSRVWGRRGRTKDVAPETRDTKDPRPETFTARNT